MPNVQNANGHDYLVVPDDHHPFIHFTLEKENFTFRKEKIEDDLPLGLRHAAAVSRRVSSGSKMPLPQHPSSVQHVRFPQQLTDGLSTIGKHVRRDGKPMSMRMAMKNGYGGMGMMQMPMQMAMESMPPTEMPRANIDS